MQLIGLGILAACFLLGLTLKPAHLGWAALLLLCLGFIGLYMADRAHDTAMSWMFGLALMWVPLFGVPLALAGQGVRALLKRMYRDRGPTDTRRWSD